METEFNLDKLFSGAENFLNILLKHAARPHQVLIRAYGQGTWQQFSGKDFAAHLGRAVKSWTQAFAKEQISESSSILFMCTNTYGAMVAPIAANLAGVNAMFLPSHSSEELIRWCIDHFKCVAIATDIGELAPALAKYQLPVFNVGTTGWLPQDRHPEPEIFQLYRDYKAETDRVHLQSKVPSPQKKKTQQSILKSKTIGTFHFVSFGHDGMQKPETLCLDALVLTSHNFLQHVAVPPGIMWKSVDMLTPSTPLSHVGRICVLLKNGVLGFLNPSADWETNLRILRPTLLFASPKELDVVYSLAEEIAKRPLFKSRLVASQSVEKAHTALSSARIAKLPEPIFNIAKKGLRIVSRAALGDAFVKEAVEDLRFVVHGLAPAQENHVIMLERLGIPVIETYGTTGAAGLLSSNTFETPFFNLIGTPLAHASFRLGPNSTLEYRVSSPIFENSQNWLETGDVVQMTAHGFAITGRERHLFVTAGGVTVSPGRLERALKSNALIGDACIVGDRMPYLSALVVLTNEAATEFRIDAQKVTDQVAEAVAQVNETLPRNVTIKKFQILTKAFQENLGEKLPNGGVNRLKIQKTHAELIRSMYT